MREFDQTFTRPEWSGNGLTWDSAWGHYRKAGWGSPFSTDDFGIFLPLAGLFRRKAQGVIQIVDPTVGFFRRPGEEVVTAHPTGDPNAASHVQVDLNCYGIVDDRDWPPGAYIIEPDLSLKHRLLRRDLRHGAEPWLIEMRLADLVDTVLRPHLGDTRRAVPAVARRHRALVADVCELLGTIGEPLSLVETARRVGCSPFHLSRLFKATTGMTMSQYRQIHRVNEVLRRIEQGDQNLGTIATAAGFADHSHMTRTVTAHLGYTPSQLRALLRRDAAPPSSG